MLSVPSLSHCPTPIAWDTGTKPVNLAMAGVEPVPRGWDAWDKIICRDKGGGWEKSTPKSCRNYAQMGTVGSCAPAPRDFKPHPQKFGKTARDCAWSVPGLCATRFRRPLPLGRLHRSSGRQWRIFPPDLGCLTNQASLPAANRCSTFSHVNRKSQGR